MRHYARKRYSAAQLDAMAEGKEYERGGLERIWRKVQADLVPLLGVRNL
jgi:hypothetical protein